MICRLEEALGGHEAYLVAGAFFAFAGAPEFYSQERAFPGLFLHGETRQGKTTTMQWMMELWGFHQMSSGIGMSRSSTAVGIQIAAEQYSQIPVWLTDYDDVEVAEEKRQIVHAAFNRELTSKWTADGTMRKLRTSFVLDGESRPHKTSTRFRYAQVLISKMNRRSDQVGWFERNRRFFFSITRALLRRREEFGRLMMENFNALAATMPAVEKRTVQVHGAPYGALMAAAKMFGGMSASTQDEFKKFIKMKCNIASEQGEERVNLNQLWVDMISAFRRGVFGDTRKEQQRFFKVSAEEMDNPPGSNTQGRWKAYTLFIEPNGLLDILRKDLRMQGRTLPLDITDYREQMSRRTYWSARNRRSHSGTSAAGAIQRFSGGRMRCWAIDVDKLEEFGYRQVSDEELEESKRRKNPELPGTESFPTEMEWADPRKGDIYGIVEAIDKRAGESDE